MTRQVSPLRFAGVDARVARSRAAVLRAATDLLVEGGPSAVTIDAVVARSGVAKSTIYRHWQSRDDVLLAVMESCAPNLPPIDPDVDVESGLRTLVRAVAGFLRDPEWARVVPALLLLKSHEHEIANLEQRLERTQQEAFAQIIDAGSATARSVRTSSCRKPSRSSSVRCSSPSSPVWSPSTTDSSTARSTGSFAVHRRES